MKSKSVNGQLCGRPLLCLLDSGSTGCLFNKRLMPFGTKTNTITNKILQTTTQGTHTCNEFVFIEDIQSPEFNNSRHIKGAMAYVFDSHDCPYDVILGRDFLQTIGIKMDFQLDVIQWLDTIVDMKRIKQFDWPETRQTFMQEFGTELHYLDMDVEDEYLCNKHIEESFAVEILQSKYGKVSVDEVADMQKHLTEHQHLKLRNIFRKHLTLFDSKLGRYPHQKFHLDLIDGTELVYQKPYGVPYKQEELFLQELHCLCDEGVLEKVTKLSGWAATTFITPKKDNRVRWVSDF